MKKLNADEVIEFLENMFQGEFEEEPEKAAPFNEYGNYADEEDFEKDLKTFCAQQEFTYIQETVHEKLQGTFEDSGDELMDNRFIIRINERFVAVNFSYVNGHKAFQEQGIEVFEIDPSEINEKRKKLKEEASFYN